MVATCHVAARHLTDREELISQLLTDLTSERVKLICRNCTNVDREECAGEVKVKARGTVQLALACEHMRAGFEVKQNFVNDSFWCSHGVLSRCALGALLHVDLFNRLP